MVDRMDKRKPIKLTRSEKKAMRRTEKLAVKLEKEQERADKIRRKKEAKRAAREEKRRKKGNRKSGSQRKDKKPTPNKRTEKKHSYSEQKSSTGNVRCTNVKRKQERNISAQNSIPYREMAKDGICRVQEKYYSKTIRFYDINYQLAQNEDKNAIFENWCDFLNYFDSTIHFQISFINHHSNMKEFESVIQIQPQNDAFDDVRMEYAQMLRDQLAKGNNGLVRTKYITFGIEAENIREAKPKLERIEADILNNFKVLGVSAYPLNGEERLQILYETFNPEEKVPFQFSYDRILRSGMGTKDFVAPTSFVFKEGKTKLLLPDGRKVSFLELLAKKEEVLVNSFDFQKQELVKARGYDVRCTKEVTELVEVELENGETVRCTPEHWFLTQSAGYVEACNLKVGAKFIPEHEVKAVRFLSLEEAVPVYDISVEGYQNFLLSCGVVVHNSGKSFAAKREIANVFFATQDDIIIGDPEGEYYPLVHALGGQVIHISPTSHDYINPMDINLDYSDDDNPLGFKSDFILSLCELIMGSRNGIEAEEKSVIDRCLPLVYQKYFENPIPENMPVLGDLYDCLRKQEEVQAQRIATALEIYVNGSLNVFNHHTNVELNNRIVCFDIKDLGKQLKKLGMLIVQDQVWNRVTVNRVAHKSTRYYIDEFHLLLKEEQTAAYSVEIWKRFRKWGGKQNIILKILQRSIVYAVLIEAEGNN